MVKIYKYINKNRTNNKVTEETSHKNKQNIIIKHSWLQPVYKRTILRMCV